MGDMVERGVEVISILRSETGGTMNPRSEWTIFSMKGSLHGSRGGARSMTSESAS